MDFFQSPVITFLISSISFAITVISFIFILLERQRKTLKYTITPTNLIAYSIANISGLSINMDGQPIKALTSTEISFQNAGNKNIEAGDFALSAPLKIVTSGKFFDSANDLIVSSSNPVTTFSLANQSDHSLSLTFDYLLPKQTFSLTILHTGAISVVGTLKAGNVINTDDSVSLEKVDSFLYKFSLYFSYACFFCSFVLFILEFFNIIAPTSAWGTPALVAFSLLCLHRYMSIHA